MILIIAFWEDMIIDVETEAQRGNLCLRLIEVIKKMEVINKSESRPS
jgi:hypothetical protein